MNIICQSDQIPNKNSGIILSEEKEKWWTCKEFYFECDNLREKFTNEKDEKKLKFLDKLNAFVEGVEKKYREAQIKNYLLILDFFIFKTKQQIWHLLQAPMIYLKMKS